MVDEPELVALLHRADWTRLCLSGEVRGLDGPPDPDAEERVTLLLAPGRSS